VGEALFAAGTGLFRVMPDVDERRFRQLRNAARAFGLEWHSDVPLDVFERSLPRDDPRTSAFLIAVRRAAGGASYAPYEEGVRPWHSAVAATYAQATAPLRRLQDRFVVEAALAVANGRRVPDDVEHAFHELPPAMSQGEQRANRAERMALDLAEAVVLAGREGEVFDAAVVDESDRGVEVQILDPAILVRLTARRVDPGDEVRVRLEQVDVERRSVTFQRIA
jgi:exoribonuclease R